MAGWQNVERKGKFSIAQMYKSLRPLLQKVPQRKIICNNKASPKSVFILWLAIQDRLSTKDRLTQWRLNCSPGCVLCDKYDENREHLFFECEYSSSIWKNVLKTLNISGPHLKFPEVTEFIQRQARKNTKRSQLLVMCFAEAIHSIWLERNRKIFSDICKPAPVVYRQIIYHVACRSSESCRAMLISRPG